MNSSLPPRFYELGPFKFQELCADLLAQDGQYSDSQVYGRNGQAQKGIDVIAHLTDRSGLDVGQCKCWEDGTTAAKLHAATVEFLPHLESWNKQRLRKFILFAACPTDDVPVQDQISIEVQAFEKIGIIYEVWDSRKLQRQLRPHRHVVRTHTQSEFWVNQICGPDGNVADPVLQDGANAILRRQGVLIVELAGEKNKELERVRGLAAEGKATEALQQIISLQKGTAWPEMPDQIRAKALRIHASLVLIVYQSYAMSKELLGKAKEIDPNANTRPLEALITCNEKGPQAALDSLTPPLNSDEWSMRLGFLLELGRPVEVLTESANLPMNVVENGEALYAKSLALLLTRQFDLAAKQIHDALAHQPTHFGLRHGAALIGYAKTISTSFLAWGHLTWPVPSGWNHIMRDPESVSSRKASRETFRQLCQLSPEREQANLRIWELACVANEPEFQDEAQILAQSILKDLPGYPPAIIWASERGYAFDIERNVNALQDRVNQLSASQDDVDVLVFLLANSRRLTDADQILERMKGKYVEWNDLPAWLNHKAQSLCAQGKQDEAATLAQEQTDPARREILMTIVLQADMRKTNGSSKLALYLENAYAAKQDDALLLSCCEAKALAGDWEFILAHADHLLSRVRTEGILRMVIQASFNCNEFHKTCELLENHFSLCAGGRLPSDLRRLRAECLIRDGMLPQAISEVEKLASETPDFANISQLFRLQQIKGDLPASTITARRFLEMPDVPPSFLFGVTPFVRLKDQELAARLWEKAVKCSGDDPSLKAMAAMQSFTLGLESKAANLLKELPALAATGRAPIKALGFEETVELIRSLNEGSQKMNEQYTKGFLPLHLLQNQRGHSMAGLFLANTKVYDGDFPHLCAPLLIRHGQDPATSLTIFPANQKNIFLDITSILLFHRLELFEIAEKCFDTILLSGHITSALTNELEQMTPQQPSLLSAKRQIQSLSLEGKLKAITCPDCHPERSDTTFQLMGKRWCNTLQWIREKGGLLIEFAPIISNEAPPRPVTLTQEDQKYVCSPYKLLKAMRLTGLTGEALESESAHTLTPKTDTVPFLPSGMTLYLEHGVAAELAQKDLLVNISNHCHVYIDNEERSQIKCELELEGRREDLRLLIETLLQRISYGLGTSKYRIHVDSKPRLPEQHLRAASEAEMCLWDAIHFGELQKAPVCIDDRAIQAYQIVGKTPIVGTLDVLKHFRDSNCIDAARYYELLLKLRTSNARYVPPSASEILHHLRRAIVTSGRLQETPSLRTLRRSIAASLLDGQLLQEPMVNNNGEHLLREMSFPLGSNREIGEALLDLWSEPGDPDEIQARADWLWFALVSDLRFFRQCFKSLQKSEADLLWLGATVGMLFAQGLRFTGQRKEKGEIRRRFFEWVAARAYRPVLKHSDGLLESIAGSFRNSLACIDSYIDDARKEHGDKSHEAAGYRILAANLIMDLPDDLREKLSLSGEAMERYGLQGSDPGITLAGVNFSQEEFWSAVSRAFNCGGATLKAASENKKMRLTRTKDPNSLLVGKQGIVHFDILGLFHESIDSRRAFASKRPWWFDLNSVERGQAIEKIISEKNPAIRVRLLDGFRDVSMANFYKRLRAKFETEKSLQIDDLMPKTVSMLPQFLRLNPKQPVGDFLEALPQIAESLISSEGLEETIFRIATLPVELPQCVLDRIDSLNGMDRNKLLDSLSKKLMSYQQMLHFGRLCCRFATTSDQHLETFKKFISNYFHSNNGLMEAEVFVAILRWVHLRLSWTSDFRNFPASTKLAVEWMHTSILRTVFESGGPAKPLSEWFLGLCSEMDADYASSTPYDRDVCNPKNVDCGGLYVRGLAFIFAEAPVEIIHKSGVCELLTADFEKQGKAVVGSASLWRIVMRQPNHMPSYLGYPCMELIRSMLETDALKSLYDADAELNLQLALKMIQERPHDAEIWSLIEFLAGAGNLNQSENDLLAGGLAKVEFRYGSESDPNLPHLISAVCYLASALSDVAIKERLRMQILNVANSARSLTAVKFADDELGWDTKRLGAALIDGVWKLNSVANNPSETISGFLNDASALFRAWPLLAREHGSWFVSVVNQLPVQCQTNWLPLQLQIRALG